MQYFRESFYYYRLRAFRLNIQPPHYNSSKVDTFSREYLIIFLVKIVKIHVIGTLILRLFKMVDRMLAIGLVYTSLVLMVSSIKNTFYSPSHPEKQKLLLIIHGILSCKSLLSLTSVYKTVVIVF